MDRDLPAFCPRFHHAVELVGRRWTGVILRALFEGVTRFSDIAAAVPDLSDKLLAERLKELDAEGIVTRTVIPETPVRIEYRLTAKGRALETVMEAVTCWAEAWIPGGPPIDIPAAPSTAPSPSRPSGRALRLPKRARNSASASERVPTPMSASEQITTKIEALGDWRGATLAWVRQRIHDADPEIQEEWKWAKPTSPGTPVWSHDGIVCTGESYQKVVKLTFARGAAVQDPEQLFNASLEGNTRRAIDIREGETLDAAAFMALIRSAVAANTAARTSAAQKSAARKTAARALRST